jgi:hypothetical protein
VDAGAYGIDADADSDSNTFNTNKITNATTAATRILGTNNEVDGKVQNTVSTTDATDTVIATIAIPDDSMTSIEIEVVGFRTNGTDQATYKYTGLVSRHSAGIAVLTGAVNFMEIETDGDWDATIDIDGGNNARIRVTGAVGSDVNWKARHVVTELS